jgi:hypothetical protein
MQQSKIFFYFKFFKGHVWQNYIFVQNKTVKIGLRTCFLNTPLS